MTLLTNNSTTLNLNGNFGGPVGVVKTGLGTVTYQVGSDNSYSGITLVKAGTLQLNVGGFNSFADR